MRTVFHERLERLTVSVADICGLAGLAMKRATESLLNADLVESETIIGDHDRLVQMRRQAEREAVALLALQAPVARDLRVVVSSLQNAADGERMGGLATHIAQVVRRRHPAHVLPSQLHGYFVQMGRTAAEMGDHAGGVVLSCDPRKAAELCHEDDVMNDLHVRVLAVLVDQEWKHGLEAAVDVTLLNRFFERFADHAVEIARRVIFQATGQHIDSTRLN
jgi:phosphate transport system protein